MDTDQKKNTQHVNSFTKGMNSDTSYDMVDAEHYLFGQNIRITNNTSLNGDITSSTKENIVTAISNGVEVQTEGSISGHILATASIGNIGAVIVRNSNPEGLWSVYKAELKDDKIKYTLIFTSSETTDKDRFSVVINKELEDCIKLYIADGKHSVMCIDLLADDNYYDGLSEEHIISNHIFPTNRVKIEAKISGQLKTQQLQYTYRFYKKYGVASKLAPLTNKIQVINNNRNIETGNAEDTKTSIGFKLRIDYDTDLSRIFDHIQIYRISYIKKTETPEVNLITDAQLTKGSSTYTYNDTDNNTLATLTLDEFTSMNGTVIIPQVLEQNQNILFAANVKDDTVIRINTTEYNSRAYQFDSDGNIKLYSDTLYSDLKTYTDVNNVEDEYYLNKYVDMNYTWPNSTDCKYDADGYFGGTGPNISWRFITCNIPLDYTTGIDTPIAVDLDQYDKKIYYINSSCELVDSNKTIDDYLDSKSIYHDNPDYNNIITSSLLRSLRRDEVYRYGIVFYDSYGNKSDVLWIADIRTPKHDESDIQSSNAIELSDTASSQYGGLDTFKAKLDARPIGIEFNVTKPQVEGKTIIGYEIVRCEKTADTSRNLLSTVISRALQQGKVAHGVSNFTDDNFRTPYYPNVFLTSQFVYTQGRTINEANVGWDLYDFMQATADTDPIYSSATNVENVSIYQIYSPQINIARVDELDKLQNNELALHPICFVYDSGSALNIDIDQSNIYTFKGDTTNAALPSENNQSGDVYWLSDVLKFMMWNGSQWTDVTDQYVNRYQPYGNSDIRKKLNDQLHTSFTSNHTSQLESRSGNHVEYLAQDGVFLINTRKIDIEPTNKPNNATVFKSYNRLFKMYCIDKSNVEGQNVTVVRANTPIKQVADVKNPTWDEGFTDYNPNGGTDSATAVKQYKSYITSLGTEQFVNWAANGMYDMPISYNERYSDSGWVFRSYDRRIDLRPGHNEVEPVGYIGPGAVSFIINTQKPDSSDSPLLNQIVTHIDHDEHSQDKLGTLYCTIQHSATQFAGLTKVDKQYDTYVSHGNFTKDDSCMVFDGNIYITAAEIINLYKTYNFNDYYTLISNQVVYYIPMESEVNTRFDYGLNYTNTSSKNVQLKPGVIAGIASQDRAAYQYNLIYSDNERSIVKYTAQSEEESTQQFKQRIHYSQNKTNGESIDNWNIFKPIDYIDADSRYGEITHLLSANNTLYYWQTNAFGKLSVNERSLITDTNSNTIQLGQGGVLQRTDYINTFYGMQPDHLSAIAIDGSVYWIDSKNKAIVAGNGERVINYCEAMNVQNISNSRFSNTLPQIDYDLQNMELLCKTYKDNEQLVFNLKLPAATAIYTRDYDSTITFDNVLYGLKNDGSATRLNYNEEEGELLPTKLEFVVNAVPSVTKVFDNQQINITDNTTNYEDDFAENRTFTFSTDLCRPTIFNDLMVTDREGNINYAVPRENNAEYGNRMRGKWMKVTITDDNPSKDFAISHIITKFRYSFI